MNSLPFKDLEGSFALQKRGHFRLHSKIYSPNFSEQLSYHLRAPVSWKKNEQLSISLASFQVSNHSLRCPYCILSLQTELTLTLI